MKKIIAFIIRHSDNGCKRFAFGMSLIFLMFWFMWSKAGAQNLPTVNGTLRGKYEYQTSEGEGRFEVRTARISFSGELTPIVSYKAEIDLCDEGKIKMLDAYTRLNIKEFFGLNGITKTSSEGKDNSALNLQIGQMRVPFTIDAHRSPHQQYFANRSFIAKQVGNVRDVGAQIIWTFGGKKDTEGKVSQPTVYLNAGIFNGSGLTDQKDYWTRSINFSAKAQIAFPQGLNIVLSSQKIRPNEVNVMMYDGGIFFHKKGWHIEGEYLFKKYARGMFDDVHAFDVFLGYDIKVREKQRRQSYVKSIEPLVRYDYMTDHSDGKEILLAEDNSHSLFKLSDFQRGRLTSGLTIHLLKPFVSDIRINYEKYFYGKEAQPKISEHDKFVIEFMTRF